MKNGLFRTVFALALAGLFALLPLTRGYVFLGQPAAYAAYHLSTTDATATAVPGVLSYQGYLTDGAGNAAAGTHTLGFAVYAAAAGGTALWTETQPSVSLRGGYFSVLLGQISPMPANLFSQPQRYLGVTVDGNLEMVPRQPFASVAYALNAGYADTAGNGVFPGLVVAYAGATPPAGWLLCDGRQVSRTTYAALYAAIGSAHGSGDGTSTFNLPDYRGRFLRGVDGGVARDPNRSTRTAANPGGNTGDAVGSVQGDSTKRPNTPFTFGSHTHGYWDIYRMEIGGSVDIGDHGGISGGDNDNNGWQVQRTSDASTPAISITGGGDSETRPQNADVNWIIKY